MKKKLFENIGDNMFKLRKDLSKNEGFDATGEEIDATITLINPETDLEDPESNPEEQVDVIVTFTYYEPIRGSRDEPDAPGSIEISSVKRQDNMKEIINSLSVAQITTLEKSILGRRSSDEPDQYDEAKGNGYNGYRITSKEKKLIAKNLEVFPELKGLKKLESFKSALGLISKSLDAAGFELDMVTGDILLGQQGTRLLTFSKSEVESFGRKMPSESVVNSRINFTWENLSGDQFNPRYEVIAYVS